MTWTRGRVRIILYDMMTRIVRVRTNALELTLGARARPNNRGPTLCDFVSRDVPRSGCVLEFQRRVTPRSIALSFQLGVSLVFFFLFHSASDRQVVRPIQADRNTI